MNGKYQLLARIPCVWFVLILLYICCLNIDVVVELSFYLRQPLNRFRCCRRAVSDAILSHYFCWVESPLSQCAAKRPTPHQRGPYGSSDTQHTHTRYQPRTLLQAIACAITAAPRCWTFQSLPLVILWFIYINKLRILRIYLNDRKQNWYWY